MFEKLFTEHPAQVGETYAEHFGVASRVGWQLFTAGLACFMHALVPAWFKSTGSATVRRLHGKLVKNRADHVDAASVEWVI